MISMVTLVAQALRHSAAQRMNNPMRGENLAHRGKMRFKSNAGKPPKYMIPEQQVPMLAMADDSLKGSVLE